MPWPFRGRPPSGNLTEVSKASAQGTCFGASALHAHSVGSLMQPPGRFSSRCRLAPVLTAWRRCFVQLLNSTRGPRSSLRMGAALTTPSSARPYSPRPSRGFWAFLSDATFVSPVRRDGSARPGADSTPGLILDQALNQKHPNTRCAPQPTRSLRTASGQCPARRNGSDASEILCIVRGCTAARATRNARTKLKPGKCLGPRLP